MIRLIHFALIAILTIGCASTSNLRKLSVGMDKNEVVNILGEPISTRASARHAGGVEIWDYNFREKGNPIKRRQKYFIYFKENKVIQWGQENDFGDIEREPDFIQKVIIDDEKETGPRFH